MTFGGKIAAPMWSCYLAISDFTAVYPIAQYTGILLISSNLQYWYLPLEQRQNSPKLLNSTSLKNKIKKQVTICQQQPLNKLTNHSCA